MQQVELECRPQKNATFVDPHELLDRSERRALLNSLAEVGQNDFLAASAYAFCIDHMDLLCCHDPVTGQKQLDQAVMQSPFELYETMCEGPDSVGTVSRPTFNRILLKAMREYEFKVRESKTVSKCEICKFCFDFKENLTTFLSGILLHQLLKSSKREHKSKIIDLMTEQSRLRQSLSGRIPSPTGTCHEWRNSKRRLNNY